MSSLKALGDYKNIHIEPWYFINIKINTSEFAFLNLEKLFQKAIW